MIVFLIINTLIIVQFLIENNAKNALLEKRYMSAIRTVHDLTFENNSIEEINKKISFFDMKLSNITIEELLKLEYEKINIKNKPIEIYIVNNIKYISYYPFRKGHPPGFPPEKRLVNFNDEVLFKIKFKQKIDNFLLIDQSNEKKFTYFWLMILFVIDFLLIWFLFFLKRKLKPLIGLKGNMIKLSKGDLKISTKIDGKDEIAQVANEFNNALIQLKQLKESRNLFLRNIMHELKTPITKGKLITDIYEESESKNILTRVFIRLEYLLNEFAKIEELTSGKIKLNKDKYFAIELVEQAFDILLLEDNVIEVENMYDLQIHSDFELFSIALKNLIDNAIRYTNSSTPKIIIEKNGIKIINKATKLEKDIEEYYKPFNHEYETALHGLGLGLYISNNIIKIHNYKLKYEYKDGNHIFFLDVT